MGEEKLAELEAMMSQGAALRFPILSKDGFHCDNSPLPFFNLQLVPCPRKVFPVNVDFQLHFIF